MQNCSGRFDVPPPSGGTVWEKVRFACWWLRGTLVVITLGYVVVYVWRCVMYLVGLSPLQFPEYRASTEVALFVLALAEVVVGLLIDHLPKGLPWIKKNQSTTRSVSLLYLMYLVSFGLAVYFFSSGENIPAFFISGAALAFGVWLIITTLRISSEKLNNEDMGY